MLFKNKSVLTMELSNGCVPRAMTFKLIKEMLRNVNLQGFNMICVVVIEIMIGRDKDQMVSKNYLLELDKRWIGY